MSLVILNGQDKDPEVVHIYVYLVTNASHPFLSMQIIIIMCQIRLNSMAIIRMKSSDPNALQDLNRKFSSDGGASASAIEQVSADSMLFACLMECHWRSFYCSFFLAI